MKMAERINPFIAGQTGYTVQSKKSEKTEQAAPKETVDVKGTQTADNEQALAKTDSELIGAYFGFNATKGVKLAPEFEECLAEVLPNELASIKRYNAVANENRISAAISEFESFAPVSAAEQQDAFEAALANVNPKFVTPEIKARIAGHMPEIEEQLNPFFV